MSNEDRVDAKTDEANIYRTEYAKRIITFGMDDAMKRRLLQHVFHCSERTTYDWIRRVKQDPDNFHSHPHTGRPPQPIPGKEAMRKILEDADAKERNLSMREVVDATNSRLVSKGATTLPSESIMYEWKNELGYSLVSGNTAGKKTDPRVMKKRQENAAACVSLLKSNVVGVMVDECSANQRTTTKHTKVVAKKGQPAAAATPTAGKTPSVTITAFVGRAGLEMATVKSGSQTSKDFVADVKKFLLSHVSEKEEDVYLFLDNAPIHSERALQELQEDYPQLKWCFLPPYSPDTNVAESLFHMIKCEARRNPAYEMFKKQYAVGDWVKKVREVVGNFIAQKRDVSNTWRFSEDILEGLSEGQSYMHALSEAKKKK